MKTISKSVHIGTGKQSIKDRKSLSLISNHNGREHENYQNENIDLERIYLNEVLIGSGSEMEDVQSFYDEHLEESFNEWRDKAMVKNPQRFKDELGTETYLDKQVREEGKEIATQIIFQVGNQDFWEDRSDEQKRDLTVKAFESWQDMMNDDEKYKDFHIVSATLHMDETSPHIHVMGIPVKHSPNRGQEYQVSKNHVFGNRDDMDRFHELSDKAIEMVVKNELGKDWELSQPLNDDPTKPMDVREYRKEVKALKEAESELSKRKELVKNETINLDFDISLLDRETVFINELSAFQSTTQKNMEHSINSFKDIINDIKERTEDMKVNSVEERIEAYRERAEDKEDDFKIHGSKFLKNEHVRVPFEEYAQLKQDNEDSSKNNKILSERVKELVISDNIHKNNSFDYVNDIQKREKERKELSRKNYELVERQNALNKIMEEQERQRNIIEEVLNATISLIKKMLKIEEIEDTFPVLQHALPNRASYADTMDLDKRIQKEDIYNSTYREGKQMIGVEPYFRLKSEVRVEIREHEERELSYKDIPIIADIEKWMYDRKSNKLNEIDRQLDDLKPDSLIKKEQEIERAELEKAQRRATRKSRSYDYER